jgi:hypothetical protein
MSDDVRPIIYGTIIGFLLIVLSWLTLIFISSCGFSLSCVQAAPIVIRTSVPTLIPVSQPQQHQPNQTPLAQFNACKVSAADLIGAWVAAGSPETETFPFNDVSGNPCEGTFANDIQHLFMENEFWFPGAIGCTSCHNTALIEQDQSSGEGNKKSGGLDLTSYQGILAGANRSYVGAKGTDILGGGNWDSSLLHDVLLVHGFVPQGHSKDVPPIAPVFIYAGQHVTEAAATATGSPTATPAATATVAATPTP